MRDMSSLIGKIRMVILSHHLIQAKSQHIVHKLTPNQAQEIIMEHIMLFLFLLKLSKFILRMLIMERHLLIMPKMR